MHFKNTVVGAMAYALPDDVWTSSRIEEALQPLYDRLSLQQGRLAFMTGIQARRHWPLDMLPSEAAVRAGKKLLSESFVHPDQIDVLIHASVCRNRLEPATAAYIHRDLDLSSHTQIFDLSNACLGVLNAMMVGASMIEAGTARTVLIISGENGHPLLDHTLRLLNEDKTLTRQSIKPFFANLTIGSGAVAILLRHVQDVEAPKPIVLGGVVATDTRACHLCEGNTEGGGLAMQTDSSALLDAGIALSQQAWSGFKNEMCWDETSADHIVTHQVGRQHQVRLYEALNLDISKDFSTFQNLGNTGSVALPISLCLADEQAIFNMGDRVLLLGIGSGLSSLMLGILWQK